MEKKRLTKLNWYGSDVDNDGKPIVPGAAPEGKPLEGLNEGEIYIHNNPKNPSIYIRATNGSVLPIKGEDEESLSAYFLRKDKDDRSKGKISSDKGFEVGNFNEGVVGSGAAIFMRDGSSYNEVDYLTVRKKATFTNITVQELKHVGGEIILSPAAMVCSRVEEIPDGFKCYFNKEDSDGRKVYNEFEVGDQARCQTFNLSPKGASDLTCNHYYWRLVVAIGEDYITLSKTDCDNNSDIPLVGDNISQLGNRTKGQRQAAIILSAYGSDAPSYKQYNGVNSYTLNGKQVTKLSPYGNELTGKLNIETGSVGWENLEGLPDSIQEAVDLANKAQETIDNTSVGAVNLLRNSGFTGDYQTEDLTNKEVVGTGSDMYSRNLLHWEGNSEVIADSSSISGYSVKIGELSQSVAILLANENYVVSFKAKGSEVTVTCGSHIETIALKSSYAKVVSRFTFKGTKTFKISGNATICDLKLERGTIATDWGLSPLDNDRAYSEFLGMSYIYDAIKNGSTSTLGGLVLSNMIQLGNFRDVNGDMVGETKAGVSGIYNNDDDVAFWGGGTFEQAIKTVVKFKEDPRYRPTEEEWKDLANFVVSHGGDAFFRGYVYALGGFFRGAVDIANGKIMLNQDGSGSYAGNNIWWNKEGVMYRRAPEVVEWRSITDFQSTRTVTYDKGLYFDLSAGLEDRTPYVLSEPDYDKFSIIIRHSRESRRSVSATLNAKFRVYDGSESVEVEYLKIDSIYGTKGKSFTLDYEKDTEGVAVWYARGETCSIINEGDEENKKLVAYLGKQEKIIIGESVGSRTEIGDGQVNTSNIEATSATITGTLTANKIISRSGFGSESSKFIKMANSKFGSIYNVGDAMTPRNTAEHFITLPHFGFNYANADVEITSDDVLICCADEGFTVDYEGHIVTYNNEYENNVIIRETSWNSISHIYSYKACYEIMGHYAKVCSVDNFLRICVDMGLSPQFTICNHDVERVVSILVAMLKKYRLDSSAIINTSNLNIIEDVVDASEGVAVRFTLDNETTLTNQIVDEFALLGVSYLGINSSKVKDSASAIQYALEKGIRCISFNEDSVKYYGNMSCGIVGSQTSSYRLFPYTPKKAFFQVSITGSDSASIVDECYNGHVIVDAESKTASVVGLYRIDYDFSHDDIKMPWLMEDVPYKVTCRSMIKEDKREIVAELKHPDIVLHLDDFEYDILLVTIER